MQSKLVTLISFLTAILFFLPLVVVSNATYPFIFYKEMWLQWWGAGIFATYLIAVTFYYKRFRPRFSWLGLTVLVFYCLIFLASVAGVNFWQSFWDREERMLGLFALLHYGALFVVWRSVFNKEQWLKMWKIFVAIGCAPLLIALYQVVDPRFLLNLGADRVASTLGNPIYTAAFALFTFFSAIIFSRSSTGKIRMWWFGAALVSILAIFATQTRGAIIGLWAGVFVLVAWAAAAGNIARSYKKAALIGLVALIAGPVILFSFGNLLKDIPVVRRFVASPLQSSSGGNRLLFWKMGWNGWKEKKLLGWGWENFYDLANKHYEPALLTGNEEWVDNAHNEVVNTLATTGVAGLVSYLAIFGALFYALFKLYRSPGDPNVQFTAVSLASLFTAYFVQNLFAFDTHATYLYFFWLVAGIDVMACSTGGNRTIKVVAEARRLHKVIIGITRVAVSLAVVCAVFVVLNALTYLPAKADYIASLAVKKAMVDFGGSIRLHAEAIGIHPNPYSSEISYDYGNFLLVWMGNHPDFSFSQYRALAKDMYSIGTDALNFYLSKHPRDTRAMAALGRAYQDGYVAWQNPGFLDKAEATYLQALELNPRRQSLMFGLAKTKVMQQKVDDAIAVLQKAEAEDPSVPHTHWQLALAYDIKKDAALSYAQAKQALDLGYSFNSEELVKAFSIFKSAGHADTLEPQIKKALSQKPTSQKLKDVYYNYLLENNRLEEADGVAQK